MSCQASSEAGETCCSSLAPDAHPMHYGNESEWVNESYVEPPSKVQTPSAEAAAKLKGMADRVPPRQVRPYDFVGHGDFDKEGGMDAALNSSPSAAMEFRSIFTDAIIEVAERLPLLSSDDVWDHLLAQGYWYRGTKQSVPGMMSKTAVGMGILTPTVDKVPPRHKFQKSGLDNTLYRSLTYRGSEKS